MLKINLSYIIITVLVLFIIVKSLPIFTINFSKSKKCTDCNVWNHLDTKSKCERLCKENNLSYSGKSTKINNELHCNCS